MFALGLIVAAFANCNMHMTVYGALGAILLLRSVLAANDRRYEAAVEDAVSGIVHVILASL